MKLPNHIYDALKWLCILCLPAAATLYSVISAVWHLPYGDEIPKTLIAIGTFIGAVLGISNIQYNADNKQQSFIGSADDDDGK